MKGQAKVLVLIFVALLALSMYYYQMGSIEPMDLYPGQVGPEDDGKLVRVEGAVRGPKVTDTYAFFHLVDVDDGDMVKVYCRFGPSKALRENLVSGAKVEVVGEVKVTDGRPEVQVTDEREVMVWAPPDSNEVSLKVIFKNREVFDYMTVSVLGVVQEFDVSWGDATIVIKEGRTEARCVVTDFSEQIPIHEGSTVRIVGRVWFEDEGKIRVSAHGWNAVTVEI